LRILRRGITFGDRPDLAFGSTLPPPETGVGLLFMCYAARLLQSVMQQDGADSKDLVKTGVGPDSVIGRNATPVTQQWLLNGHAWRRIFLRSESTFFGLVVRPATAETWLWAATKEPPANRRIHMEDRGSSHELSK
jgi:hypothetical protein